MKTERTLSPETMFADGGELSELVRSHDWAATPLGPIETWSQPLRTMVGVLLAASEPMFILWGSELTMLYNDSYRSTLGQAQHPQALGAAGMQFWYFLEPMVSRVMMQGQAAAISQLQQFIPHESWQEECYYSFCCSPIYDELGLSVGVLCLCHETTDQVISSRRLQTLRSLHALPSPIKNVEAAGYQALNVLSKNPYDIPFALLYLVENDTLRLVDSVGVDADMVANPLIENLIAARVSEVLNDESQGESPYSAKYSAQTSRSLAQAFLGACKDSQKVVIEDLEYFDVLLPKALTDTWNNLVSRAVLKPLLLPEDSQTVGMLVVGVSPTKAFDQDYQGFIDLVVDYVDRTIVQAAIQTEKRTQIASLIRQKRAAKEARRQLKLALATGRIGTWEIDLKTQTLTASNQHKYNYGLPAEADLTYEIVQSRIHPSDCDRVTAAYQATISQGIGFDEEYRLVWADGSIHWLISRAERVCDETGEADRLIGVSIDVTERKQAEQAAKVGGQRFRDVAESNLFGVVFGTLSGELSYANDYVLDLLGYRAHELASHQVRWDQITPAEFALADQAAINQLRETGTCEPYEKAFRHKDGSKVPVLVAATLLQQVADQSQEVMAFILDLTRLKQVTEERDRFFRLSPDMHAVGNFEGYFTQVNPAWVKVLGYTSSELTAQPYLFFIHPDDREMTAAIAANLTASEDPIEFENRYRCKDGSYRWLLWKVTALIAEGRFYAVARDITTRKQVALEREAAREAAERANRIKDEFLAVVSHELRSPLNPILGWSQLLKRGTLDEKRTKLALASIERNAQLQVQLIGDLLDISRILRNKLILDKAPVDLESIIFAALETVKQATAEKSIHIETTITPCTVVGDAVRLQQVVWNLLSNAVKFTPRDGSITVTVTADVSEVVIEVSDTGKGIAADFLPFVFEHFRQENYSTTRKFGGLGLGLAIVRQIVDLHDGTVAVRSPGENQGTTFSVCLPRAMTVDGAIIEKPAVAKGDLSGLCILVVDDEDDSKEITTFTLESAGATVVAVSSGYDALAVVAQAPPDIIISDIGMPEMDGYMLMQQIRALAIGQDDQVKAIALSAYATENDEMRILEVGFQQHLTKPVAPARLVEAVINLLNPKQQE
ncbi:PAS fold family [Synechococcus sp. PCC 7335]|uniref:PAS domain-containing hybrid sensor histidine kinase/response regulator n=1 Tax=Synechococcus sp. (strain ATCC 29403 / PCC 7335) TaxID=91464 RepID=UPI00017ED1E4|nr:PAS domain S-box protein [Synechococcus sp. PCC 7335]EDX85610.1 PAS fold family [Synechococcus sp. PCC 7335]